MSEWWTYSLNDFLLFAPQTFYRLFELHNAAWWPIHLLMVAAGFVALASLRRSAAWHGRAMAAVLAGVWLFVGSSYFVDRYATINWAAVYFAGAFAIQAVLFMWTGLIRDHMTFPARAAKTNPFGFALLLFAVIVYPLIALALGRVWAQTEVFGIAPDPTVVATLGVLLAAQRTHWHLMVVPLLWCAVSGLTQYAMHAPEAFLLPAIAAVSIVVAAAKTMRARA